MALQQPATDAVERYKRLRHMELAGSATKYYGAMHVASAEVTPRLCDLLDIGHTRIDWMSRGGAIS